MLGAHRMTRPILPHLFYTPETIIGRCARLLGRRWLGASSLGHGIH